MMNVKKFILAVGFFLLTALCVHLFAQSPFISASNNDLREMKLITIKGYKAIRHDALIRLKFNKVHEMNLAIKKLQHEL